MRCVVAALCGVLTGAVPFARAAAQMDMSGMSRGATLPLGIPESRLGSGTSWLPDAAPMHAIHVPLGGWTVMAHGVVSLLLDTQSGPRGATEAKLINWGMASLAHAAAGGRLELRVMLSAEPATVGAGGYPLLLQSGESNHGVALHDRQHPHDLFMETALLYDRAINRTAAVSVYLAPAGEPALGPPAYPHRPSAAWDPLAPIGHHWQDGAHVTYGVATAGIYTRAVKFEGSLFNGREPDENRTDFDFHGRRLDSYSGRAIVNPARGLSVSAWFGYLKSPEALEPGTSLHRVGAALLASGGEGRRRWSGAAVYGANIASGASRWSNSALLEASVDLDRMNTVFGRVEYVQKSSLDLALPTLMGWSDLGECSLGYARTLRVHAGMVLGVGARGTVNVVPPALRGVYGSRFPLGAALYASIRPTASGPHHMQAME
ncbi:MAG TPA: hypothetical protein VKB45_15095 [Gemmatimonadales bacterium]|nr:hypothetical protein [Gemmatimonadales bacterium]